MRGRVLARATLLLLAVILLLSPRHAWAASRINTRFPIEYRTWTLEYEGGDKQTLSQLYLPVITTLRVSPTTNLVVSTAHANTELDVGSSGSPSLSGFSDLQVNVWRKIAGDRLLLLGGVNLPSGKRELSKEEYEAARALGHPLLGMRLKQYGCGFDLNGGIALSVSPVSGVSLGMGAGYLYPGSYSLLDIDDEYSPTAQTSLSAGANLSNSPWAENRRSATVRATFRAFSVDKFGGEKVFEEGDQLELSLQAKNDWNRFRTSLSSLLVMKDKNTTFQSYGDSLTALKADSGTGSVTHLLLQRFVSDRFLVGVEADWKNFSGSDRRDRNGDAYEVGPTIMFSVGRANWCKVRALYMTGSAGEGEEKFDLSGYALSLSFIWRLQS